MFAKQELLYTITLRFRRKLHLLDDRNTFPTVTRASSSTILTLAAACVLLPPPPPQVFGAKRGRQAVGEVLHTSGVRGRGDGSTGRRVRGIVRV